MNPAINLIKQNHMKKIVNTTIIEEIVKNKEHNLMMELVIGNSKGNLLYQAFCEENAKENEHSRIKFFNLDKFPDGIFILYNKDDSVECHICELKVKPTNKLEQLKEQLFSGYIHCKSLLSILNIDSKRVEYFFNVFLIIDDDKQAEYNTIPNTPKKMKPGTSIPDMNDYERWKQNKLTYNVKDYFYEMELKKIKMLKVDEHTEQEFEKYSSKLNL